MFNRFWLISVFLFPITSQAANLEIPPFSTFNQSPLIQIYGIPHETSAEIIPTGSLNMRFNQDISSSFTIGQNSRESITIDGENYRMSIAGRYGFADRLEIGFDIPYVIIGGGFLDNFIINWHDTFALPQGERDTAPKNRIKYNYRKDGVTKLQLDHATSGIGDISVTGGYSLINSQGADFKNMLAVKGAIKLPTGSSSDLIGSGGTDLMLQLCGSMERQSDWGTVALYGSVGAVAITGSDILSDQYKPISGTGTLGVGWKPASWIQFKTQLNANTALYRDSSLTELSQDPVMLILGGALEFPGNYLLDIGVSEDLWVSTAPDVSFHLGLSKQF